MKTFGIGLIAAVLAIPAVGCGGGGIEEGIAPDANKASTQPAGFEDMMKNMGKNMTGQKKKSATAPTAGDAKPDDKAKGGEAKGREAKGADAKPDDKAK